MARVKSGTLTPSTAVPVTVTGASGGIDVINRTQTGTVWVSLTGTATVAGDDCYPVLGNRHFPASITGTDRGSVTVSVISDAALEYTVEGFSA